MIPFTYGSHSGQIQEENKTKAAKDWEVEEKGRDGTSREYHFSKTKSFRVWLHDSVNGVNTIQL